MASVRLLHTLTPLEYCATNSHYNHAHTCCTVSVFVQKLMATLYQSSRDNS